MSMLTSKSRVGFTILELLVVIASIGILTTVVLVSVNDARIKAKAASAIQTLESTVPTMIICEDEDKPLNDPTAQADTNNPAIEICAGSAQYAKLEAGWSYSSYTNTAVGDDAFTLQATDGDVVIECTQVGCEVL